MRREQNLSFEEKFVKELNSCRRNPQKYSLKIRSYIPKIKDDYLNIPKMKPIKLEEGTYAFEEAAMFLDNLDSLPILSFSEGLSDVCKDIQNKIENSTQKEELINLNIEKSLSKYGDIYGPFSQQIEYYIEQPEILILLLLVDDGNASRSHRTDLLNFTYKLIGIDHRPHQYFTFTTTFVLARHFYSFTEKPGEEQEDSSDEEFDNYKVGEDDLNYFSDLIGGDFVQKKNKVNQNGKNVKFIKTMKIKNGVLYTDIAREEKDKNI